MMARLLRAAIFMASFLLAGTAFAAGGTCPSGANYPTTSLATPGAMVTLASIGVTNCYYVAANGSDSNDGASEAAGHPWAHAPGMPNCTGNCLSVQNSSPTGTGFIFRGGDHWHFGNSSATPYVGSGGIVMQFGGSSGHPDYWGVDLTWWNTSNCTKWCRPVLDGDNGLTPNPGVILDYVASCPYSGDSSAGYTFWNAFNYTYTIVDDFEFTGICQNFTTQNSGTSAVQYIGGYNSSQTTVNWMDRLYLHGWTHVQWSAGNAPGIDNIVNIAVGSAVAWRYVVIDGSDSDPGSGMATNAGTAIFDVAYSIARYTAQGIGGQCHVFHDNIWEHWDSQVHPNFLECNASLSGTTGAYYNNIFRHVCTDLDPHGVQFCSVNQAVVGIWPTPAAGDYWFNNLIYDVSNTVEYFSIGQNGASQGPLYIFNNEMEATSGLYSCTSSTAPVTFASNLYIYDSGSAALYANCSSHEGAGGPYNDLIMTHATATADKYTASETYAYSPPTSSSPTVGAGTNEGTINKAYCTALSTAASSDPSLSDAAAACLSDTRYSCTYDSVNHAMTNCPTRTAVARPATTAWDIGAYQYSATQSSAPNPPTGLMATVQ